MSKNNFLRKFLTTTSAFALIASASSAMAALVTDDNGGDVIIGGGGDANTSAAFNDNDSFYFSNAGKALTTNGALTITSIDLNGNAPGKFTVTDDTKLGSVVDVIGANSIDVIIADDKTLTLTSIAGRDAANAAIAAKTFTGLGNITINDNATLTFNSNATLAGDIDSDANENGAIVVNLAKEVIFNGIIGGTQKIDQITIESTATFNKTVTVDDNINLNNKTAKVIIGNKAVINGEIDAEAGDNHGDVIFNENATVTGEIGASNTINNINIIGANGDLVTLNDTVDVNNLSLTNGANVLFEGDTNIVKITDIHADSQIRIKNAVTVGVSNARSIRGDADDIVFEGNDSDLTFDIDGGLQSVLTIEDSALNTGVDGKGIIGLGATGYDGAGTNSLLTARGEAIGGANTFQKITVFGDKTVRVENKGLNTDLLTINNGATLEYAPTADVVFNKINFADNAGTLKLEATAADRKFTLNENVDPSANDRGIIILHSNGGNAVTLGANGLVKTLGTVANKIKQLNITGDHASIITDQVDLTNILELNVGNASSLDSKSSTVAKIAAINIGEAAGAGTLIIDANVDYDLNNGGNITFVHADSALKLTNTTGVDRTITLKANLTGGADKGILEINSNGTNTLDIAQNAAETIGVSAINRIKELIISGDQNTTIDPDIFAKTITINSTGHSEITGDLDSGIIDSAINFTEHGTTEFNGDVTTKIIDFADKARKVDLGDLVSITTERITSIAGSGSKLVFTGNGDLITKATGDGAYSLDLIQLSSNLATVTLGAGNYTVNNIELVHELMSNVVYGMIRQRSYLIVPLLILRL